jgi:hypothetical protein
MSANMAKPVRGNWQPVREGKSGAQSTEEELKKAAVMTSEVNSSSVACGHGGEEGIARLGRVYRDTSLARENKVELLKQSLEWPIRCPRVRPKRKTQLAV